MSSERKRPTQHKPAQPVTYSNPPRGHELQSSYADDPMTKLWQNAEDRETGAEAVEAIRARRRNLGPRAEKKSGPLHRYPGS